jgi:hypothetical protein
MYPGEIWMMRALVVGAWCVLPVPNFELGHRALAIEVFNALFRAFDTAAATFMLRVMPDSCRMQGKGHTKVFVVDP